ncbi:MAG: hypothetical protein ACP5H0_07555, partial [Caldisericum sp.]
MNINKVEKIIRLYLEGLSSREIANRVGLSSHQSVLNVISAWKAGNYEIYQEAVTLENEVIELAKFRRDKNIDIEELSNALTLAALIKDLNLDYGDTILAVQHMKNIKVEERKQFLEGVTAVLQDLQNKGISYKDLPTRVVELQNQVSEMEGKIEKLKKEQSEYEEKIKSKKDEVSEAEKALENIRREQKERTEEIELAKKYEEIRKSLGISDEKYLAFINTAKDMNYDISRIMKIDDLSAFAAKNRLSKENLMEIVQGLNEIKEHGINLIHIPALKDKLKAENYELGNAEARFIEYISKENEINNVQKKKIEELKAKEKSLNDEIGKLEKEMNKKERMVKDLDEKIKIAENFTNFLNLHNIKEEDFLKFFSTFHDVGFEIEKIRNISNLYDKITKAGYSYDELLDAIKKCLNDHDTLEKLSKLGFTYDDILTLRQFFEFSGLDWSVFVGEMFNFISQMKTFNERKNELDKQLNEIKNKISIEEELYNEAIKKHEEIEEYGQLLEKIEVLKKDVDDASKTLKDLKDEISRKREETQILDDLQDLLNKRDELLQEINDNQNKINIGLGIWELFKYSDPAEQEHLKPLAQMIVENFPYRVESLVVDLRDRAIKMLVDLTNDGVVVKQYGNGKIRIISGDEYDRNVENFKKIMEKENWIRQELMKFTNNCISEIEATMKKRKVPEHVMALFKNAIDKFIERQYEEALKNAEIESISKEIGSAFSSLINIYLASKGKERISVDEKIFITGELDGKFSTFGIGIDEIAEAIVKDQRIIRGKYSAEWHRVLRSMLFSRMKSVPMP